MKQFKFAVKARHIFEIHKNVALKMNISNPPRIKNLFFQRFAINFSTGKRII